ncbi:MAG: hypothetical protein FGM46_02020 [Ferruginibacter sp.]|nr:hypothetical protein [Ferruginibacter sp.]
MQVIHSEQTKEYQPGGPTKFIAHFLSYIFHPVFTPIYITYYLLYLHPLAFVGFSKAEKIQTLIIVALNLTVFPLISVLLLKALGFIQSIYLRTQKDRIIPYIASGIFFFWAYTVFKQQQMYPLLLTSYVFGVFLASSAALIANIYLKVSMHAIGMGGWLALMLLILFQGNVFLTWPFALVILLSGLICSARLLLNAHQPKEIYIGFFLGMAAQIAAAYIVW